MIRQHSRTESETTDAKTVDKIHQVWRKAFAQPPLAERVAEQRFGVLDESRPTDKEPARMKVAYASNQQGDANFFAMLAECHSVAEPPPRDYAEYERRKCVQQRFGMRAIYRDPVGER